MDESVEPEAVTPAGVDDADDVSPREVGVGPWDGAWPDGEQWDPELLRDGDRRNVVDRYRYWTREAIVADLDDRRHPFHVAIGSYWVALSAIDRIEGAERKLTITLANGMMIPVSARYQEIVRQRAGAANMRIIKDT